jgi:methanogenic corrinoid protein MtbC1
MFDFETLKNAMADLEDEKVKKILHEVIKTNGGKDAPKALEACQVGMSEVGKRFEKGEYFVGDLIFAGEILSEGMEIMKPALAAGGTSNKIGKVILCTVHGDVHDIGKNIVKSIFEAGGFEVIDLGIDTPVDKIVNAAKEMDIKIIALSGVLTMALDSMQDTVKGFKTAGLREKVKIIIGGNPVSEDACKAIEADAWAHSPQRGVEICKAWVV